MAENRALEWLTTFRSARSRQYTQAAAQAWREHRRARGCDADELLAGLAERLVEMGLSVVQCSLSLLPLHPEVYAINLIWSRAGEVERYVRTHDFIAAAANASTPLAAIKQGSPAIRLRLDGEIVLPPIGVLRTLRDRGATEFFVIPLELGDGRRSFFWCATDRPGGFADEQIAAIEALEPHLAVRVDATSWEEATEMLLDTYLGANAAARVLDGAFKRGTGEVLRAVLWFCDLRGFTSLVDTRPLGEVIPLLDRYFETMAGPVEDAGGQILKFIGDAMLAVFLVDERGPEKPCEQALGAALAALARLAELERTEPGWPSLKTGVALHLGEVMYGNIGARTRLDFTVIGPAVNETARVEGLCKELGVPLLITDAFRAAAARDDLVSLGHHTLRGVAKPVELFTAARYRTATSG